MIKIHPSAKYCNYNAFISIFSSSIWLISLHWLCDFFFLNFVNVCCFVWCPSPQIVKNNINIIIIIINKKLDENVNIVQNVSSTVFSVQFPIYLCSCALSTSTLNRLPPIKGKLLNHLSLLDTAVLVTMAANSQFFLAMLLCVHKHCANSQKWVTHIHI